MLTSIQEMHRPHSVPELTARIRVLQERPSPASALCACASGCSRCQTKPFAMGGTPLTDEKRAFFERGFGVDLSGVHIHEGPAAVRACREFDAGAMAWGSDVFLGAPAQLADAGTQNRVLAHELAHVVQQRSGGDAHIHDSKSRQETCAERAATAVLRGHSNVAVGPSVQPGPALLPPSLVPEDPATLAQSAQETLLRQISAWLSAAEPSAADLAQAQAIVRQLDPLSPLGYATFEEYRDATVGQLTEAQARAAWVRAMPDIRVPGESRLYWINRQTALAELTGIRTGSREGLFVSRSKLVPTTPETISAINAQQSADPLIGYALQLLRTDAGRYFDATRHVPDFPNDYYVEFSKQVLREAIRQLGPEEGVARARDLFGVEVGESPAIAVYHVYESIASINENRWDRVQHFVRSAAIQFFYGDPAADMSQGSKEFVLDEVPSWATDDEGWSTGDMRANNLGQEYGRLLRKSYPREW